MILQRIDSLTHMMQCYTSTPRTQQKTPNNTDHPCNSAVYAGCAFTKITTFCWGKATGGFPGVSRTLLLHINLAKGRRSCKTAHDRTNRSLSAVKKRISLLSAGIAVLPVVGFWGRLSGFPCVIEGSRLAHRWGTVWGRSSPEHMTTVQAVGRLVIGRHFRIDNFSTRKLSNGRNGRNRRHDCWLQQQW